MSFQPATLTPQIEVPLAVDNFVCAHCGVPLLDQEWAVVATPKHKGICLFSCRPHLGFVMNMLSRFVGLKTVPNDIQLPDDSNN